MPQPRRLPLDPLPAALERGSRARARARTGRTADHCLAAAYRGECPDVSPDDLMRWRAESRAAYQGRTVDAVLADVEAARQALMAAPRVDIAGVGVADLGQATVPEAPEAAARYGIPFTASVSDRDGRKKRVLQAAPPEVISAAMAEHSGAYGDPARGFCGWYEA